jgi:hypothetical protein
MIDLWNAAHIKRFVLVHNCWIRNSYLLVCFKYLVFVWNLSRLKLVGTILCRRFLGTIYEWLGLANMCLTWAITHAAKVGKLIDCRTSNNSSPQH